MAQPANQPPGSRVCPKCGYHMGASDTSCFRCALFSSDETPPPITPSTNAPAQPARPTPAPSAPLPSFLPAQPAQAPASAPGRPVAPPSMPAPPPSARPAYTPPSSPYSQRVAQPKPAPARLPTIVTVVSIFMIIFAALDASIWSDITAAEVCNKILHVGVYGSFAWALLTRQSWARKWSIPAVIGVFCIGTLLSIVTFQQTQAQITQMMQHAREKLQQSGVKITSHSSTSSFPQADPAFPPPTTTTTPDATSSTPGMTTPTTTPDATSSTPGMTTPTPGLTSSLPSPSPGMPAMPPPSSINGMEALGGALTGIGLVMKLVGLIIGIFISAGLTTFFLIALTRPSVIDAFGE